MAANYWVSTQRRHWQFTREGLADIRKDLEETHNTLVQQYGLPDRRLLSIFFNQRRSTGTAARSQNADRVLTQNLRSWGNG